MWTFSSRFVAGLLVSSMCSTGLAQAFDIVGVRPGMTMSQAADALKNHNSALKFFVQTRALPDNPGTRYAVGLRAKDMQRGPDGKTLWQHETLELSALPSGSDAAVIAIRRQFLFRYAQSTTWTNFVAAIKEKYGAPTMNPAEGLWVWFFDQDYNVLPRPPASCANPIEISNGISSPERLTARMNLPRVAINSARSCGRRLVIIASRSSDNRDLVSGGDSILEDGLLAASLTEALHLRLAGKAEAEQQRQIKDATAAGKPKM